MKAYQYEKPAPLPAPIISHGFAIKCIGCLLQAEMIFEGSSYCEQCLKEKLRMGK